MHGWFILDKPLGLGSTQAVSAVKRGGQRQYLLYANLGTTRAVQLPRKYFDVRQACTIDGQCSRIVNRTVRVNQAPVLLKP